MQTGELGKYECRYVGSALDVEYVYSQLYYQFTRSPHNMAKVTFISTKVGSPQLKKVHQSKIIALLIIKEKMFVVIDSLSNLFSVQLVAESRSCVGEGGVSMAPEVSQLVDYVWTEANGQLEEVLAAPIETFKTEQVEKAEAALLSLKRLLTNAEPGGEDAKSERVKLEAELYGSLSHKPAYKTAIDSMRAIAQKQDLCQVSCQ